MRVASLCVNVQGMRIPLGSIWRISKVAKNTLLVHCKDFRPNIRFRFASKNLARHWHDVHAHPSLFVPPPIYVETRLIVFVFVLWQILHQNAFPGKALKTFAFDFKWEVGVCHASQDAV